MKPLLSICIPTANRIENLTRSVESIIIQQPYIEGKVEIVVSDNSDGDETRLLMLQLINNHRNIRYHRNEVNTGAINFSQALQRGTGIYRKLSNDTIIYNHRSLSDMVYTIEQNMEERPVILWGIYRRIGKDYVKTDSFEEVMRTISYLSTWIGLYGIWEDEADCVVDDCKKAKEAYQKRFREKREDDIVAQRRFPLVDIAVDTFWHLRYMQKKFEDRGGAVIVDSSSNWNSVSPPKTYEKGVMKWFFYDYYMDILKEFCQKGLISQQCVDDLERDLGFSFFVDYLVDFEFPTYNIKYDPEDNFIEDVLSEYRDKDYFNELYDYYQLRRQKMIERLSCK